MTLTETPPLETWATTLARVRTALFEQIATPELRLWFDFYKDREPTEADIFGHPEWSEEQTVRWALTERSRENTS